MANVVIFDGEQGTTRKQATRRLAPGRGGRLLLHGLLWLLFSHSNGATHARRQGISGICLHCDWIGSGGASAGVRSEDSFEE